MNHYPFWVRLLLRVGLSPQKILLCLSDLAALLGTAVLVFLLRAAFGGVDPVLYRWVMPLLVLAPVLGVNFGLYQSISLPPHRELKALFQLASLVYGIILAVLFLSKTGDDYSRIVIAGGWAASVLALPFMRGLCRRRFARRAWWGRPLLILDRSDMGRESWHYLKRHPERGLNPVDIFELPEDLAGVRALLADAAARHPSAVVLLLHRVEQAQHVDYATEASRHFSHILLVPAFGGGFRLHWLTPRDLGNAVGLLVRQNLRDKRRLWFKRCLDITLCMLGAVLLLPVGLGLALAIRLDSPGPVFFRQERIGLGGRTIRIFKFRTMVAHADDMLARMLACDEEKREEWNCGHKLRDDPRITRVGGLLRKYSLDELPQLLNVVVGDMSLVGPRPIVASEVERYGPVYEEYCMVRPGITGLWQVSGRNDTTYGERVEFDSYYISNWSVWLDWWILAKTLPVVIAGKGAY